MNDTANRRAFLLRFQLAGRALRGMAGSRLRVSVRGSTEMPTDSSAVTPRIDSTPLLDRTDGVPTGPPGSRSPYRTVFHPVRLQPICDAPGGGPFVQEAPVERFPRSLSRLEDPFNIV
jgi:hypothetical protein